MEKVFLNFPSAWNFVTFGARVCFRKSSFSVPKKWTNKTFIRTVVCSALQRPVLSVTCNNRFHVRTDRHTGTTPQKKKKKTIQYDFKDREDLDALSKKYTCFRPKKNRTKQLYILDRNVAQKIIDKVWPNGSVRDEKSLILECNAGVGLLTEELALAGAPRVAALENEKALLPFIEDVAKRYPERLQCVYGDATRLDPLGNGEVVLPALTSKELCESVGVRPATWESDPVLKVIQILAYRESERSLLLRNVYSLISRYSWFQYGRIESILVISEKHYQVLTQTPGRKYQLLSLLYNMCCDIQLLHVEPRTSFCPQLWKYIQQNNNTSGSEQASDIAIPDVYVVRVTPKKEFFSYSLCPQDYDLLLYLSKQLTTNKSYKLMQTLENWIPGYGSVITKYGFNEKTRTGDVSGEMYLKIFLEICRCNGFENSWLREEAVEFIEKDNSSQPLYWITKSKFTF